MCPTGGLAPLQCPYSNASRGQLSLPTFDTCPRRAVGSTLREAGRRARRHGSVWRALQRLLHQLYTFLFGRWTKLVLFSLIVMAAFVGSPARHGFRRGQPLPTPDATLQMCARCSLLAVPSLHGRFEIAPMMDVTDEHFRHFARSISREATLWTEMLVDNTAVHNEQLVAERFSLPEDGAHSPCVLQLGGSNPQLLAEAVRRVVHLGYDEINLNCGCPSDKVSGKGCFGAALMRSPLLVAEATARMAAAAVDTPISVKCRIGVDDHDSYDHLADFVRVASERGGVRRFIIHARKAILKGLSPAQNRSVPPLKYDRVYRLIREFPHLTFTLNGGLASLEDAEAHMNRGVHGVMLGRAVRDNTWEVLAPVDLRLFASNRAEAEHRPLTRRRVLELYAEYVREIERERPGVSASTLVKPLLSIFHGEANGRRYRATLSERSRELGVAEAIHVGMSHLSDEVLDRAPGEPAPQSVVTSPSATGMTVYTA